MLVFVFCRHRNLFISLQLKSCNRERTYTLLPFFPHNYLYSIGELVHIQVFERLLLHDDIHLSSAILKDPTAYRVTSKEIQLAWRNMSHPYLIPLPSNHPPGRHSIAVKLTSASIQTISTTILKHFTKPDSSFFFRKNGEKNIYFFINCSYINCSSRLRQHCWQTLGSTWPVPMLR